MVIERLMTGLKDAGRELLLRAMVHVGQNEPLKAALSRLIGGPYRLRANWDDLDQELGRWRAAGKIVLFWWRDDDAVRQTPQLERLLALRRAYDVPLGLSVIPARAQEELAEWLNREEAISVLQHGWAHTDHSRTRWSRRAELGSERPLSEVLGELVRGCAALDRIFGEAWPRVVVPPFNYIAPSVAAALPQAGYIGLSAHGFSRYQVPGLTQTNVHIDIMDWSKGAFLGDEQSLGQAVAHMRAKRHGLVDPDEPTGIGTHHLQHDDGAWRFLGSLLARLTANPAVQFCNPEQIFSRRGC